MGSHYISQKIDLPDLDFLRWKFRPLPQDGQPIYPGLSVVAASLAVTYLPINNERAIVVKEEQV